MDRFADLEQVEVRSLLEAGHQALMVPHLCHDLPPLLDQGAAPALPNILCHHWGMRVLNMGMGVLNMGMRVVNMGMRVLNMQVLTGL